MVHSPYTSNRRHRDTASDSWWRPYWDSYAATQARSPRACRSRMRRSSRRPMCPAIWLSACRSSSPRPSALRTSATTRCHRVLGLFRSAKCYTYQYNADDAVEQLLSAHGLRRRHQRAQLLRKVERKLHELGGDADHRPVRWALTGGYRSVDSTSQTILEKAWASNQGSTSNFPTAAPVRPPPPVKTCRPH